MRARNREGEFYDGSRIEDDRRERGSREDLELRLERAEAAADTLAKALLMHLSEAGTVKLDEELRQEIVRRCQRPGGQA